METSLLGLARSGLIAQQTRLDMVSHNIANLQTPGFRAFRAELVDLPPDQSVFGLPSPPRLTSAEDPTRGVAVVRTSQPDVPGSIVATNAPLDLALPDGVYLAVRLPNGQTGYTRDGHVDVGAKGAFQINAYPLVSNVTMLPGDSSPSIDEAGNVVVVGSNGPRTIGKVPLVQFARPENLEPLGNGVLQPSATSGQPMPFTPTGLDRLATGALEASNVRLDQEFSHLIRAQRAYQLNAQFVRTWDELAGDTVQDLGRS